MNTTPMINAQEVDLRNAKVNNIGGNQYNNPTIVYHTEDQTLERLKPAARSGHHVPACMEKTRESIFNEIYLWLDNKASSPNIMWITSSPGAGKSAIASSLISNLTKQRRLGSFFFFKRGDANLGDPAALWRTVAYDLARFHPCIRDSVVEFLSRPGFRVADILLHFECMIEGVLRKSAEQLSECPPIVVLDALDECGSDDAHSIQRHIFLDTITRWSRLPRIFKLIVTSRDERIPTAFYDPLLCYKITLETGESVSPETQNDIRVFFEQRLDQIRPIRGLPSTWPGEPAIELLTKRAAGLFIWAKTAMAFLEEKRGSPSSKLKLILAGNLGKQNENIDSLYRHVLDYHFNDADDTTLELFKMVVGAIIVARVPVHRNDLRQFLHVLGRRDDEDDWEFNATLHSLSSVIELDGPHRLKHLSFAEFLSDINRCGDERFVIDPSEQHQNLALACLRVMNAELRFNICGLKSSHVRNDDVQNLDEQIATSIPSHLSYSCRYWAAHLCGTASGGDSCKVLLKEVREFFYVRLLYWLEVMSLINEISASSIELLMAASWVKSFAPDLSDYARDASRFVINFYTPISESAPHIYLSALPFAPRKSLISQQFLSQFPGTLSVAEGKDDDRPPLVNMLTGHFGGVEAVAYSPDGKRVVSGSVDKTVCVWDIETGQIIAGPFKGHTDSVLSVAFSPNGNRAVSGSADCTACVWDLESGQIAADPFKGHTWPVLAVAFSVEGDLVSSCSVDERVYVWNAKTCQVVAGPFGVFTNFITSVAFSPDRRRVTSNAFNVVSIWDLETGKIVGGPFESLKGSVLSIAFSPDGKRVAVGSGDKKAYVWDVETGKMVGCPLNGHTDCIWSVGFSPDSERIVSGSVDKTVCVWDIKTGQIVAGPFTGHTDSVCSVAFSPDGRCVISSSVDKTVCVWDVKSGRVLEGRICGHTAMVHAVAFSPDWGQVVSGSADKALCVWDITTGQVTNGPFTGHTSGVRSVAFSPDGKQVVSGSDDKTVCVWNAKTGQIVAGPFHGHDLLVSSVAFSPDGKCVTSSSLDKTVRVWDIERGQLLAGPFHGHTHWVLSVEFSPDGKRVVSGSFDETARVWEVMTGRMVAGPFIGHSSTLISVAYSPDGKRIVTGSLDLTVRVWDAETGQTVAGPFVDHTNAISSVAFSPDGRWVVSGASDKTLRVWDSEDGQMIANPFARPDRSAVDTHTSPRPTVAFSPDGKRVISASFPNIQIWYIKDEDSLSVAKKQHFATLQSMGGPSVFTSCQYDLDGWATGCASTSKKPGMSTMAPIFFWVPHHSREGLCDDMTHFPLGVRRTRLDLSRFVHGTSWTLCHPHPCRTVNHA